MPVEPPPRTVYDQTEQIPSFQAAAANPNLVSYEPDPVYGGMREVAKGYYRHPDMGGAVTVPSASRDPQKGLSLSGFDPNAPQKSNVIDTAAGGIVVGEMISGSTKMATSQPPAENPDHFFGGAGAPNAATRPSSEPTIKDTGFMIRSPNGSTRQISEEEVARLNLVPAAGLPKPEPLIEQELRPAYVPGIPKPKPPGVRVEIGIQGMTLREMYHEVIFKPENKCLVLVFDTTWAESAGGRLPPVFQPNEEDKPFMIKVAQGQKQLTVQANYFGQTFEDTLKREFTVFGVIEDQNGQE